MDENLKTQNTGVDTTTTDTSTTGTETKTYTQEEVDALLQREGDRRVTDALKKAERKNADKVREAQKLAQMDSQQKYEYELKSKDNEENAMTIKIIKASELEDEE